MLRLSSPRLVVFQNPNMPRVLKKLTPERMELTIIALKERKKKIRYMGSALQHFSDRWGIYGAQGTPRRGTRFIIERTHTRAQYVHPGTFRNSVGIRTVKMAGAQYDQMGNYTRTTWDHSCFSTNILSDPTFKRMFRDVKKDQAVEMLEEWGVRYVLLDEIRKPSLVDCKYHKHQLFADKFSWSPDPETNYFRGDAEFKWKGDELIAYGDFNAQAPHPNHFARTASGPNSSSNASARQSPWFSRTVAKPQSSAAVSRSTAAAPATATAAK